MTLGEALRQAIGRLDRHGVARARLNAESLVAHSVAADRACLYTHDDCELTAAELQRLEDALYARIRGVPVQYIVGRQEFYGRDFLVDPSVLIPRPETELVVESVLETDARGPVRILDVGCGSGCIGITLALELPGSHVMLTDISLDAVRTAKRNATRLGAAADVACMDLADAVAGPFDFIVSNPPYIRDDESPGLQPEVRDHEPHVALFGGADGLDAFRRLIPDAARLLHPGGYFICEMGYGMKDGVLGLFGQEWNVLPVKLDLQGIPRTVRARRVEG